MGPCTTANANGRSKRSSSSGLRAGRQGSQAAQPGGQRAAGSGTGSQGRGKWKLPDMPARRAHGGAAMGQRQQACHLSQRAGSAEASAKGARRPRLGMGMAQRHIMIAVTAAASVPASSTYSAAAGAAAAAAASSQQPAAGSPAHGRATPARYNGSDGSRLCAALIHLRYAHQPGRGGQAPPAHRRQTTGIAGNSRAAEVPKQVPAGVEQQGRLRQMQSGSLPHLGIHLVQHIRHKQVPNRVALAVCRNLWELGRGSGGQRSGSAAGEHARRPNHSTLHPTLHLACVACACGLPLMCRSTAQHHRAAAGPQERKFVRLLLYKRSFPPLQAHQRDVASGKGLGDPQILQRLVQAGKELDLKPAGQEGVGRAGSERGAADSSEHLPPCENCCCWRLALDASGCLSLAPSSRAGNQGQERAASGWKGALPGQEELHVLGADLPQAGGVAAAAAGQLRQAGQQLRAGQGRHGTGGGPERCRRHREGSRGTAAAAQRTGQKPLSGDR